MGDILSSSVDVLTCHSARNFTTRIAIIEGLLTEHYCDDFVLYNLYRGYYVTSWQLKYDPNLIILQVLDLDINLVSHSIFILGYLYLI